MNFLFANKETIESTLIDIVFDFDTVKLASFLTKVGREITVSSNGDITCINKETGFTCGYNWQSLDISTRALMLGYSLAGPTFSSVFPTLMDNTNKEWNKRLKKK